MPSARTRRGGAKSSKSTTRKSLSVNDFRSKFAELDKQMRHFITKNNLNNPAALMKQVSRNWTKIFNKNLSGKAANSLAAHYANLHGKKSKQSGGQIEGAPLDYVMRPGMPSVATYSVFPTEAGADAKASGHLDVYYNSAIGRSCGTENTTATVPSDMGSNLVYGPAKVGGARRNRRKTRRGGSYLTAMSVRPWTPSSTPASTIQVMSEKWMGQPAYPHDASDPSVGAYRLASSMSTPFSNLINPTGISVVDKDITTLANPSPYPAVR